MIDRYIAFLDRWSAIIGIANVALLGLSTADYAGFIDLPTFWPNGMAGIMLSAVINMLWWGVLAPKIARRRKELQMEQGRG